MLLAYLMASPEFAVIDGAPAPSVEPFGLLEGLPVKVLEEAREWERHVCGGGDGVIAEPAARRNATSGLRPGEHDDRREGPSQGGRVGREPAYGKGAAGALRAAGTVGSGGSAGGATERGDRTRRCPAGRGDPGGGRRRDGHLDRDPVASDPAGGQGGRGHLRAGCRAAAGQDHVLQGDRRGRHRPAHVRVGGHASADREPAAGHVHPDARGPPG